MTYLELIPAKGSVMPQRGDKIQVDGKLFRVFDVYRDPGPILIDLPADHLFAITLLLEPIEA